MEKEKYRNMTISLKVAAEEKIMLKRLAEKYNVTLSEFLYNIVMCFNGLYAFIGRLTPREEKLAENLRLEKKKNTKMEIRTENAEFRVEMEMNRADKAIHEKDELTFLLKEQKAINADQMEELKRVNDLNKKLQEENNKLKRNSRDNQLRNIAASAVGLFAGFSLKR
ncbi:MAG: hypothetical protein L7S72_10450 [Flavobacteriales bacterium]|nr:hypothetical protein [Flavobacteriales bacterium]